MSERGLGAYAAELVGTMFLVFIVTSTVVLYVASGANAQFGSDFAVVGLVHAFVLTVLIIGIGVASGGHFNPAITAAAAVLNKIHPVDAVVYILAQVTGGVAGAYLTKAFLDDEGRASDYGATKVSDLLGPASQGALIEGIGAFLLVLTVLSVALYPRAKREWAPLAIGLTLGFLVMVFGPLTGGSFNPARWFGPALASREFDEAWVYIIGPLAGGMLAAAFYKFVIEPSKLDPLAPPAAGPAAGAGAGPTTTTPPPPPPPPPKA